MTTSETATDVKARAGEHGGPDQPVSQQELRAWQYLHEQLFHLLSELAWQDDEPAEAWADRVLQLLVPRVGGLRASLYVSDSFDSEGRPQQLRRLAGFALDAEAPAVLDAASGGLVGQAAMGGQHFDLEYEEVATTMQTPTGTLTLNALLVQPLVFCGQSVGVLEMAALQPFALHHKHLLRTLEFFLALQLYYLLRFEEQQQGIYYLPESAREDKPAPPPTAQSAVTADPNREGADLDIEYQAVTEAYRSTALESIWLEVLANPWVFLHWQEAEGLVAVSPSLLERTGYQRTDLEREPLRKLVGETDPASSAAHLRETIRNGRVWQGALPLLSRDGTPLNIQAVVMPLPRSAENPAFLLIGYEAETPREQQEGGNADTQQLEDRIRNLTKANELLHIQNKKLIASEAHFLEQKMDQELRLKALQNTMIISQTDAQGNIVYVSDPFLELSGYTRDELIGQNHRILKAGTRPAKDYEELWRAITSGNVWKGEFHNRARDGSEYWLASTISLFVDAAGNHRYMAVSTDITTLKQREMALKDQLGEVVEASEQAHAQLHTLNAAQAIARTGNWEYDFETERPWWSQQMFEIFGLESKEVPTADDMLQRIPPEDIGVFFNTIFIRGLALKMPFDLTYSLQMPNGSLTHVFTRGIPVVDAEGEVSRLRGVCLDITDFRSHEQQLREQIAGLQEQLRAAHDELIEPQPDTGAALSPLEKETAPPAGQVRETPAEPLAEDPSSESGDRVLQAQVEETAHELEQVQGALAGTEHLLACSQSAATLSEQMFPFLQAARTTLGEMIDYLRGLYTELPELYALLSYHDRAAFTRLSLELLRDEDGDTAGLSREQLLARQQQYAEQLAAVGVDQPEQVAEQLLLAGVEVDLSEFAELFTLNQAQRMLTSLRQLGLARRILNQLKETTERVDELAQTQLSYLRQITPSESDDAPEAGDPAAGN